MKKSMPLSTYSFCNVSTGGSAVLGMVEVRRTVPNGARETRLYGFSIASDVITIMTNQQGVPYLPMTSWLYCACAEARFTVEGQVSQGYDNILYFKALVSQLFISLSSSLSELHSSSSSPLLLSLRNGDDSNKIMMIPIIIKANSHNKTDNHIYDQTTGLSKQNE